MNAQPNKEIRYFADEGDKTKRVRTALDERMQRWASWQLRGKPLAKLGLPTASTLVSIQSLHLTERVTKSAHTANARQSTVAKMIRDEECRDEEITERAVFELGKYGLIYPAIIRAEHLWIVPIWDNELKVYQPRRIRPDQHESEAKHRRRMAMYLGRSLERYLQLREEARIAMALLIEQFDPGWISAATGS